MGFAYKLGCSDKYEDVAQLLTEDAFKGNSFLAEDDNNLQGDHNVEGSSHDETAFKQFRFLVKF